jgi:hypothetical protein
VDFLLDAADRAMAELRRRHPRLVLAVVSPTESLFRR